MIVTNSMTENQSFSITLQEQQALWDREFIRLNSSYSKEELIKLLIGERPYI